MNTYNNNIPKDFNNNSNQARFLNRFIILIFTLLFALIPISIFFFFAKDNVLDFISSFKEDFYDNVKGTVISASIVDTGQTKSITNNSGKFITIRLYESEIRYQYQDNGSTYQKTLKQKLAGENEIKNFYEKYYIGAKINLKINPRNREEVTIASNTPTESKIFIGFFIFIFAFGFISLAFTIIKFLFGTKKIYENQNTKNPFEISNNAVDILELNHKINSLRLKVINLNDALNQKSKTNNELDWSSINNITCYGYKHKILRDDSKLIIKREIPSFVYIFMLPFLMVGIYLLTNCQFKYGIFVILFVTLITFVISINKIINFDKLHGLYYEGKNNNTIPLSNIKALQFICYEGYDDTNSSRVKRLFCELNLILNNNERHPIFKEASLIPLLNLTDQIADFLHLKVFIGPKIDEKMLIKYL